MRDLRAFAMYANLLIYAQMNAQGFGGLAHLLMS